MLPDLQVDAIQRRLLEKVDGVLAVHEFHVWQLAGDRIIASAHIRFVIIIKIYSNNFVLFIFFFIIILDAAIYLNT